MHNLYNAIENLKHRIKSLNYSGYFTQTVFDVLKNEKILNLQRALRIHGTAHKYRFHCYGSDEEISKEEKNELITKCSDYQAVLLKKNIEIKGHRKLEEILKDNLELKPELRNSCVDIPLWVINYSEEGKPNEFYFKDDSSRTSTCLVLRGIMRLYSGHSNVQLKSCFDKKLWSGKSIFEEIQELFLTQEEPDCFQQSSLASSCDVHSYCSYRSSCFPNHISKSLRSSKTKNYNINPANPDEVVYQLQEKVRALLGADYKVAVLLIDPDIRYAGQKTGLKKLLKYRAVDYFDMRSEVKSYLNGAKTYEDNLKIKAGMFDEHFFKYYQEKYGENEAVHLADQIENLLKKPQTPSPKLAHGILRNIVQATTDGITRVVWGQGVGYSNNIELDNKYYYDKMSPRSYYFDSIRSFAEGLFFSGTSVIITPLGYYGQKMGIIFTYYDQEDKLLETEEIFSRLALELAPDLFYSLEYEMYNKALNALEDKAVNDVPDILLSVFPQFLNLEAGAFWTKDQIKQINNQEDEKKIEIKPGFCRKFVESTSNRILTFNTCEKYNNSCNVSCQFRQDYIKEYYNNFEDPEFYLKPQVLLVDEDSYSKTHNIKCRLLVPVKHEVSNNGETAIEKQSLMNLDGVFDLCFDLSEHVIRRYVMDLFREIIFVYILVTNAAKQKHKVLQHATRAAVTAIVSRNHSHHIGSHVMPRATVDKIEERIKELYGKNYWDNFNKEERIKFINILKTRLDDYIQKKADFTAEIATQPLTTTKVLRFFDHIILGFMHNTLLMDNIGKNENVCYRKGDANNNRLKINLIINDNPATATFKCGAQCRKHDYCLKHIPYSPLCDGKEEYSLGERQIASDVEIALPGPLGEYAFYSFLENFIRNGIKHNREDLDKNIDKDYEVTIALKNIADSIADDEHYYQVSVYDNFTKSSKKFSWTDENNIYQSKTLLDYLDYIKQKNLINPDGSVRSEAWGLAEMLIMATLLKGSDDFMNMSTNLTITTEGDDFLAYSFDVMKPKKVAIIDSSKTAFQDRQLGIWRFESFEEYIKHIMYSSPAAFEFMVILTINKEKIRVNELKAMMPCRVLISAELKDKKSFYQLKRGGYTINKDFIDKLKEPCNLYNKVWDEWMKQYLEGKGLSGDRKPCLALFFDQKQKETVTNSWIKAFEQKDLPFDGLVLANKEDKEDIDNNKKTILIKASENQSIAIYDRHAAGYRNVKDIVYAAKKFSPNTLFYESYDKNSADFICVFKSYEDRKVMYELLEASLLKILILDERISEVAYNEMPTIDFNPYKADSEYEPKNMRLNVSRREGIYIGTHIIIDHKEPQPLHHSIKDHYPQIHVSFSLKEENERVIVQRVIKQDNDNRKQLTPIERPDALIIHQGVLENFFKDNFNTKLEYEHFLRKLEDTIPYVFVDSGRGIPPKLPDHVKFIPFSLLEEYLLKERIAKYSLSKLIMNTYRRKTI